jgi:small-conductance mechanosensitive channel
MKLFSSGRFLILLGAAAAAAVLFALLAPQTAPFFIEGLRTDLPRVLDKPYFHISDLPVTPVFLLKALVFLIVLGAAARLGRRLMRDRVLSRTSLDPGQQYAWAQMTGYAIVLIGLLIGLPWVGVDLSNLVILGGAIGIGVGLGLQGVANNFVSGLILLTERPIRVGDRVEVGGTSGDVVRIAGRSTWVRTNDNVVIIIPNAEFINNRVTNWTANDRQVRFAIPIGVSYGSDPDRVRDVLLGVARSHADVLDDPSPEVIFTGFGDSSLDFDLRVWTITRVQFPRTLASEIYYAVFRAFREHGIEIPFPQRDLHVKSIAFPIPIRDKG